MRRAMAARLQQSFRDVPHFYVAMDVDMTRALAARESSPAHVSVNDVIVKAVADALAEFPALNCILEGAALRRLEDVNIGIAVGLEDGVVVPVLARANTLSLEQVAERTRSLIADARAGRVRAGARCALTVSNLGMYGVKWFSAIITPPEVAILAVGAIADTLALSAERVIAVPLLTLTLSSDHRVIDGRLAARFLGAVKDLLEATGLSRA
jgi:pyruvate dehydrogenase E2 component (dihydrolipoamide acetyltransferase)